MGTAWSVPSSGISIHAPLTGSDQLCNKLMQKHCDFNPRSPYGERPSSRSFTPSKKIFQSTLPLRGATADAGISIDAFSISIHAPLTGSDYIGFMAGFMTA